LGITPLAPILEEVITMVDLLEGAVGFDVEATDGPAGKIRDVIGDNPAGRCLVVKPGPLHKKHVIPAGKVVRVDWDRHCVLVNMWKRQIMEAPSPARPRSTAGFYGRDPRVWSEVDRFRGGM
jgi:hypothetical protein